MCWQARPGCSCQLSQSECKQPVRTAAPLLSAAWHGTGILWARDPFFPSTEKSFQGQRLFAWAVPAARWGRRCTPSGAIGIGGLASRNACETKPGDFVFFFSLVLKILSIKNLLLPHRSRSRRLGAALAMKSARETRLVGFWEEPRPPGRSLGASGR